MNRKYWLLCTLSTVVASLAAACSPEFYSCEETRTCTPGGRAGASDANEAGNAGEDGTAENGGTGGHAGNGGETPTNGDAGSSGAPEFPTLSAPCPAKGMLACADHAGVQRLACDGAHWQLAPSCATEQFCDSTNGQCATIVTECAAVAPGATVCRGDLVLTCGPDLVTASEGETCLGRCKAGVCDAPTCGDEKVEMGEECDNPSDIASGACIECKTATCGDGVVYAGHEQCDDGNQLSGDGCSKTCNAEPVAVALGGHTTCALSSTGLVKCWGFNGTGELGLGDTDNRGDKPSTVPRKLHAIDLGTGRKATALTVSGKGSACAVLDNGDLKCWGNNQFGQLGTGDLTNRGDEPGKMGDTLRPIAIGTGRKAINVSAGSDYTCVVLDNFSVKCWGGNAVGRLGNESTANLLAPEPLANVPLKRRATAVSASSDGVTCVLLDIGALNCWGNIWFVTHADNADLGASPGIGDYPGEVFGLPALTFNGGSPAQTLIAGSVSAAILGDGSLRLWGTGALGQLGQPGESYLGLTPSDLAAVPPVDFGPNRTVRAVGLGAIHACALLNGGQVTCWGGNSDGQLGHGNTDTLDYKPKEFEPVYLGGHSALQVATGHSHSCAILDDGTVKCWGLNSVGQLGLGDIRSRGDTGGKLSDDTTVDLAF